MAYIIRGYHLCSLWFIKFWFVFRRQRIYFCSGGGNLLNFEFIQDGTISGLSSSELDALVTETTEKTVARNSAEYPNIDDEIMENFEIYPEIDDK